MRWTLVSCMHDSENEVREKEEQTEKRSHAVFTLVPRRYGTEGTAASALHITLNCGNNFM